MCRGARLKTCAFALYSGTTTRTLPPPANAARGRYAIHAARLPALMAKISKQRAASEILAEPPFASLGNVEELYERLLPASVIIAVER